MDAKQFRLGAVIFSVAAFLGITGCIGFALGKVSGRGTIPSAYSGFASSWSKASFSFDADSCAGTVTGRFNFQDRYFPVTFNGKSVQGGVKMNGGVTEAVVCLGVDGGYYLCEECRDSFSYTPPFYAIAVEYRSANRFVPGEGYAYVCIPNKGEGESVASAYQIGIRAESGPFAGYINKGEARGKIHSYRCE